MADIYDVQTALANLAQTAVYPNGLSQPSVANCPIKIYPGWPIPQSLDSDLTNNIVNVSVFPSNAQPDVMFNVDWLTLNINAATLSLTVNSSGETPTTTITVGGSVSTPQAAMIIIEDIGYAYKVQPTDTLNSVAAGIAAAVPHATVLNNVVTISNAPAVTARVTVSGTSVQEVSRENRLICTTIWAPTPLIRSQIGNAILSLFGATFRIILPDGFYAGLKFKDTQEMDILEKVKCYRRDINFYVNYAITLSQTSYTVSDPIINVTYTLST